MPFTADDYDYHGSYFINSTMYYRSGVYALPGKQTRIGKDGLVVPEINATEPSKGDFDRTCELSKEPCGSWKRCNITGYPARCYEAVPCRTLSCLEKLAVGECVLPNERLQKAYDEKRVLCTRMGCDDFKYSIWSDIFGRPVSYNTHLRQQKDAASVR